jgi:hypothetical protein
MAPIYAIIPRGVDVLCWPSDSKYHALFHDKINHTIPNKFTLFYYKNDA